MSSTQEKLHEPTILGKMVKDYRKSLGLNQTEFALLFGRTTPTAVSFWESGFREIPGSLCIALIDSAKREARGCIDCQKIRCENCERLWQT